jgi:hypothetical protein
MPQAVGVAAAKYAALTAFKKVLVDIAISVAINHSLATVGAILAPRPRK